MDYPRERAVTLLNVLSQLATIESLDTVVQPIWQMNLSLEGTT
jgi:hypothetical protein